VGGATTSVTRLRTVFAGVIVVVAAAVLTWALGFPQSSLGATLVRAIADCAAVVSLGLAAVPMLDVSRYRTELARRAAAPLILGSAVWVVAEMVRLLMGAAAAAGTSVGQLSAYAATYFALDTAAGRSGLVCVGAAALCLSAAALPHAIVVKSPTTSVVIGGAAAVGIAGRALLGHASASSLGGIAVALHALAAALWCGSLAAMVLVVEHRGRWARMLPRFSRMSLWCVVTLTACGVAAAVTTLQSPAELWQSGYGRILVAKILVTVGLTIFAWRNRAWWLPAARTHRATAEVSRVRSRIELAGMLVALTLAAGLAVTG
jgi:putative copper resistance protein D